MKGIKYIKGRTINTEDKPKKKKANIHRKKMKGIFKTIIKNYSLK